MPVVINVDDQGFPGDSSTHAPAGHVPAQLYAIAATRCVDAANSRSTASAWLRRVGLDVRERVTRADGTTACHAFSLQTPA